MRVDVHKAPTRSLNTNKLKSFIGVYTMNTFYDVIVGSFLAVVFTVVFVAEMIVLFS